jgi:mono/diheme cytochrome c family protein
LDPQPRTPRYRQVLLFGLLAASAGCERSTPSIAPTPAIDSVDAATQDQNRATTGRESINPPENTLGVLLQPIPKLPEEGSVYAVGEFPLHSIPLLPGPEDDLRLVQTHCSVCHSTSYISAQPPLSRAAWEAEVKKMRTAYGAVIPDPVALRITTYLQSYYGPDASRTSPAPVRAATTPTKPSPTSSSTYRQVCAACHLADGRGQPGVVPPLSNHLPQLASAKGGRSYIIRVLLNGLQHELKVQGQVYRGAMPSLKWLSDTEIAEALSYALSAWPPTDPAAATPPPFTAAEVSAERVHSFSSEQLAAQRPENLP